VLAALSLLTSWKFEPLQLVPTAVVALLYARRVRTLRRAGTPVPRWRTWSFGTGLVLVLIALVSPIDALGEDEFFFFHMIQHILLGDLAPLAFVALILWLSVALVVRTALAVPGESRLAR